MRRILLPAALLGTVLVPGAALAQQQATNDAGLRYLSWPGKAAIAARPATAPAAEAPRLAPTRTASATPLARIAPAPAPSAQASVAAPRGLTPASAWLGAAPQPRTTTAEPTPYEEAVAASPPPVQAQAQPPVSTPPAQVQAQAAQIQPQNQSQSQIPAQAQQEAAVDPMAPRRDAPIFRLQRPDGTTAAAPETGAALSGQSARYYSVHRQAGHEPDAIRTPAPVYLDALPVQLAQTPTSADLAQPDGPPTLVRNTDGTVRALPQTEADELP